MTTANESASGKETRATRAYKAGTLLVRENELSRSMFIIRQGQARVFRTYLGQPITLAVLGPGEVFGEMSFVDGEPRSASVEALTDLSVVAVEGENGEKQIKDLPDWVWIIFKTVFHRFREMDQKLTVLQSIHDFRKKTMRVNTVASAIYTEILRFNKTLLLLHGRRKAEGPVSTQELSREMEDLLGNKFIGLRIYLRLMREHHFIDNKAELEGGNMVISEFAFEEFDAYLARKLKENDFFIFSHSALAVIRTLLSLRRAEDTAAGNLSDYAMETMPLREQAMKELRDQGILQKEGEELCVPLSELGKIYAWQSILKAFDHTVIAGD
jgi:CRP-like cAMP-binding protein